MTSTSSVDLVDDGLGLRGEAQGLVGGEVDQRAGAIGDDGDGDGGHGDDRSAAPAAEHGGGRRRGTRRRHGDEVTDVGHGEAAAGERAQALGQRQVREHRAGRDRPGADVGEPQHEGRRRRRWRPRPAGTP